MTTSEQLERETEETRAQISASLNELRARMTPGQVVDQFVDYVSDSSGGMFFRNLRQQVTANPLPVTLMGAGLAWLAMSGRGNANGGRRPDVSAFRAKDTDAGRVAETVRETGENWSRTAKSAASNMGDRASQTASDVQHAAQAAGDSMANATASTYDSLSEQTGEAKSRLQSAGRSAGETISEKTSAVSDFATGQARRVGDQLRGSASTIREDVAGTSRGIMDFLYEQPLVLAGIGVAIGAAIGAALPVTETEDKMMGERSDALKRQTAEATEEQLEKGKAVADRAWQAASEEAKEQGVGGVSPNPPQTAEVGTRPAHPDSGETPLVPRSENNVADEAEQLGHG